MDLDRQTIEKRDFPFVRRGYDAAAVDAHLADLAGEVEALKRAQAQQKPRGTESLASAAATQVQAIVEAAETTAADIKRQAELEARRVSQDAERDAERTRDEAVERGQTHVEEVSKATSLMLQRVGAMESEVSALIESLRTGANRLTADLALLEGNMGDLYDAAGRKRGATVYAGRPGRAGGRRGGHRRRPRGVVGQLRGRRQGHAGDAPQRGAAGAGSRRGGGRGGRARGGGARGGRAGGGRRARARARPAPTAANAAASAASRSSEVDARLIALNMALNGQSREEADRYLADNFDIADRASLLDEVFAAVEG